MNASPQADRATHAVAFCFLLNQLLAREAWAREKLAPFAGEVVELQAPPLPPGRFTLRGGGKVDAGGGEPTLRVSFAPLRAPEVHGNARLAAEVQELVKHLRWDFEEELSGVVGDVAAHRIAQAGRDFFAWQADAARRLAGSFAEYAADEGRLLVRRAELAEHARAVAALGESLERLAGRIERL